jgi:ubiquinone biosynthesis monooxygenase Coq7
MKFTDPKVISRLHQMLRVNHAGELGANSIYKGQSHSIPSSHASEIQHMWDQEKVHLSTFNTILSENRVRPSLLFPIWEIAGYTTGYLTAGITKLNNTHSNGR